MIQAAGNHATSNSQRRVQRLRARAEELLRNASELMNAPGVNREESARLAYEYSVEALALLAEAQKLAVED
ncbi:MAG: hypothetical protein IAE80_12430 [Anaerolinea sp.]|nr:hypothetical protein [Anaerolinea sp.]